MIEQPKFTYFPLGKAFEKQIKTTEYQGEKQIKALEEHGKQLVKSDGEKDFLKTHRQISKNGVSKSIVHVIKHANFQLYRVHPDEVIYKI